MLNDLPITRKLLVGPALAGLSMLLLAALLLVAQGFERRYESQARDREHQSAQIGAIAADLASGHAILFRGVAWLQVKADAATVRRTIDKGMRLIDQALARPHASLDESGTLGALIERYHESVHHLAKMVELEPFMAAMSMSDADVAFEDAYRHLRILANRLESDARAQREVAERAKRVVWAFCLVGVALIFTCALVGAIRLGRTIARPLADIVTTTVAFANGKLDMPIPGRGRRDEVGQIAGALEVFRETARQLNEQAYFDRLTGIPNRANFQRALDQTLAASPVQDSCGALLLIDLDRFKEVNDTLGHGAGDAVLCAAARRLKESLRECDLVARLGGDEFAVLISQVGGEDALTALASRLIESLGRPVRIGGEEAHVSASIGIALFPDHGATSADILKHADIAMYHAKASRSGTFSFFDTTFTAALQHRRGIESKLRRALAEEKLGLVFQPKYRLDDGRLDSVESLARWPSEDGAIGPNEFIPIAEATGLIHTLGDLIIKACCRQLTAWDKAGVPVASVSINVSVVQLRQPGFADDLLRITAGLRLDPSRLLIELTETVFADPESDIIHDNILRLGELGFRLSLDDFGTGFSSMGYLMRLPFSELKIDQSFVADLGRAEAAEGVVRGIIDLGHALGMRVVAEGVETATQLRALRSLGCDLVQGYLFGCPGCADALPLTAPLIASATADTSAAGGRYDVSGFGRAPFGAADRA